MNESLMLLVAAGLVIVTVIVTVLITHRSFILVPKGDSMEGTGKELYVLIKSLLYDRVDTNDIVYTLVKVKGLSAYNAYECLSKAKEDNIEYFLHEDYLNNEL